STYHTSVLYHNKQPYMMDEVKILLPSRLTTEHHLKITFTHVAANKKKSARDALPPIGYAVVPLRGPLGNLLEDGVRNLPVAQELSTGYLSTIRAGMGGGCGMSQYDDKKWYENGKALFTVEVKGVTTVHTQSAAVLTFLTKAAMRRVDFDKASEAALLAATISLTNQTVEPLQLYRFLPNCASLYSTNIYTTDTDLDLIVQFFSQIYRDSLMHTLNSTYLPPTLIPTHCLAIRLQWNGCFG
ncbi:hypothetical protein SARC_08444, partial [Sphaeroforma arctica JP610]